MFYFEGLRKHCSGVDQLGAGTFADALVTEQVHALSKLYLVCIKK